MSDALIQGDSLTFALASLFGLWMAVVFFYYSREARNRYSKLLCSLIRNSSEHDFNSSISRNSNLLSNKFDSSSQQAVAYRYDEAVGSGVVPEDFCPDEDMSLALADAEADAALEASDGDGGFGHAAAAASITLALTTQSPLSLPLLAQPYA